MAAASSRRSTMRGSVHRVGWQGQVWQWSLAAVTVTAPLIVIAWLGVDPKHNPNFVFPTDHFLIVTLVSLLASGVAVLVALQMEQYRVALVALGFTAMAGFFSVHALATPGVPMHVMSAIAPQQGTYGGGYAAASDYAGTVMGVSAFLSLFVPAIFFAAVYVPRAGLVLHRLP